MVSPEDIRDTDEWEQLDSVIDVREYYQQNGADETIQRIVALENRKFGSTIKKLLREIFSLSKPESPQHDAIFQHEGQNVKLEIKAARYWAGTTNCKWQHLEPEYDYSHILFVLVDFDRLRIWVAEKEALFVGGYLARQGKQGFWGDKDTLLESGLLAEIVDEDDLSDYFS